MKQALINENNIVVFISDVIFEVAAPLYWVECSDTVETQYKYKNNEFNPQVVIISAEQNKAQASQLLLETDWVNQPDVTDTSINPHLLNKADFDLYRQQLRQIAVYPQAGNLVWPVKPESQWSTV